MTIDFTIPDEVAEQQDRIRRFIAEQVIPLEERVIGRSVDDALTAELRRRGRASGVWAPQLSAELGGGGFDLLSSSILLEEAGYSLLGPLALNCAAPDEGNLHLLDTVATPEQRTRFLEPLARGDVRSCFAMTEPPPGAGSDPSALRTQARPDGNEWVINGEKWLITGADGAGFAIVMARTGEHATMFLVDADNPGMVVGEHAHTIDASMPGGHCRVTFTECRVSVDDVLGEVHQGFRYAQVRLAPARLTHCMRWLGAARRAHDIAVRHAVRREAFGSRLADLGMAQQLIADNEIDLHASRLLLWQACWAIVQGSRGGQESSLAKVAISEAVNRVVDRAVQLAGGMGTSEETILGRIYADVRAFRIYDGASEVHRMSLAKRVARRATA
ncbi:acyl-CoA dehydrogenase family protein [Prauserella endophytica]|uniref:Acyl-CoA dehydrogenase n=1 Tax=Prauserella endophytica TaxID=1592324 RepID=A0ABY2S6E9_9PSEU|nr:acyl-CoA dehydrogenase family protein [Prauserella endophytica]TKG70976.1 acyl-CoA dehydrogenase [Prauserella endophytica]